MRNTLLVLICYTIVLLASMGFVLFIEVNEGTTVKSIVALLITAFAVAVLSVPILEYMNKKKL